MEANVIETIARGLSDLKDGHPLRASLFVYLRELSTELEDPVRDECSRLLAELLATSHAVGLGRLKARSSNVVPLEEIRYWDNWNSEQVSKSSDQIKSELSATLQSMGLDPKIPETLDGLADLVPDDIGWEIEFDGLGYCASAVNCDPYGVPVQVFATDGWEYCARLRMVHAILHQLNDPENQKRRKPYDGKDEEKWEGDEPPF